MTGGLVKRAWQYLPVTLLSLKLYGRLPTGHLEAQGVQTAALIGSDAVLAAGEVDGDPSGQRLDL